MKIDHIHFYVEDAQASCNWFVEKLGFQVVANSTDNYTQTQLIKSGAICFAISSPLKSASSIATFLELHPPGVADIAFQVPNLESVIEKAIAQGVKIIQPIESHLNFKRAKISAWDALSHTLIEVGKKHSYAGKEECISLPNPPLLTDIDHVVINVPVGHLTNVVAWYQEIFGFVPEQTFMIKTDHSGLYSQVMIHPDSGIKLPINEPTCTNSQIQEFLDLNRGAGVQHIALQAPNIVQAIAQFRHRGLSLLPVPASYYTELTKRQGFNLSPDELAEIIREQVLVDWEENTPESLLLQTFTQPIFQQPTFFFELIERRLQAQGFGEGNFRALFEAIEREQMKRQSLK